MQNWKDLAFVSLKKKLTETREWNNTNVNVVTIQLHITAIDVAVCQSFCSDRAKSSTTWMSESNSEFTWSMSCL